MNTNLTLSPHFATNALQVEQLGKQDIPMALALIASIKTSGCLKQSHHLKDRDADELMQLLDDGYPLLGIKGFDGTLVSFATVSTISESDDSLIIRSLCTSPDYSGNGCGKKIIAAALDWITQNGSTDLCAKVASDNEDSLSLMKKSGFTPLNLQWDAKGHYWYYMMGISTETSASLEMNSTISSPFNDRVYG